MEPVEYARLLRRRWRVVAACVLVAAVAAFITTPATPADPVVDWEATHTLVRDPDASGTTTALATVGLFTSTGEVPRLVAEEIGFDGEPAVLARRIEATPDEVVGTLSITATARSPEAAAELANLWATQTLAYLADQQQAGIGDSLDAAEQRVDALRADIDDLGQEIDDVTAAGGDDSLLQAERDAKLRQFGTAFDAQQQLEDAPPPRAGYITLELAIPELAEATNAGFGAPRSRPARAGIGAALGLLLGIALVLVLERVDPRLRTRTATEEAFQLPVLAAVPPLTRKERTGIVSVTSPGSVAAEAYRSIRSGVQLMGLHVLAEPSVPGGTVERNDFTTGSGDPKVILVTSAAPGEGKSTTAANLAAVFAETGKSVLVLGCDFRRPEVHKFFDVSATVGLSDVLAGGPGAPSLADVVKPTKVKGVRIVTNGNPLKNFGDVAATGRQLIADARSLADIVIVDTAPLLATNDAVELIPAVDSVVLVSRSGQTTSDAAKRARELIARLSAPVAGVVLVGAPREGNTYGGYYGGYYSSGPSEPDAPEVVPATDEPSAAAAPLAAAQITEPVTQPAPPSVAAQSAPLPAAALVEPSTPAGPTDEGAHAPTLPAPDEPAVHAPPPTSTDDVEDRAPARSHPTAPNERSPVNPEPTPPQSTPTVTPEGHADIGSDVPPSPPPNNPIGQPPAPAQDRAPVEVDASIGVDDYERLTGRARGGWEDPLDWDSSIDWDELDILTAPDVSPGPSEESTRHDSEVEGSEHHGRPS